MNARMWWVCLAAALASARELDPAGCAARFDVQRDKIIRTEESRGLGARYLSELDVGARAECLRLCCETDACDVFVFEEKSPGSCYLFNCGPPEDFRCKFTAHSNFSSGVLALSRRLAELQDRERLAHHERALASLRGPTTTTTTTVATTASTTTAPRPPQPPPLTSRCSRYQFECRRGGECIAVYNACDGVPQCADGSDEAPELGCPVPPAPAPAAPPAPTPPPPPPPPFVRDEGGEEATELWPHRLTQAQAQVPRRYGASAGTSAHIFSHAGGLVQESAFEPPAPDAPWSRRPWQQPHLPVSDAAEAERNSWSAYGRAEWADGEPRRAWPVPPRADPEMPVYMPPKAMPELPMVYSSQQQTLRDSPKKGFELASKADYGTEPPAPPPARVQPHLARPDVEKPAPIESSTKKKVLQDITDDSSKATRAETPAVSAAGAGRAAALPMREHFAADEHDGLSEHPPAAVLLLVLGTLMTAALGGLLACRARASRRRRHRPRMALDSDYLVNGMYL